MSTLKRAAAALTLTGLVVLGGLPAEATARPAVARTASAPHVEATGAFVATVFFDTLRTREVGRSRCELTVQGQLTLSGTVEGVATGTTRALVDAPCPEATNPANLGAFRDVFRFTGTFDGTVAGVPADGSFSYAGVTRPGGSVDANLKLRAPSAKAQLRTVTARLGIGGTYRGVAVTRG